MEVGPEEVGRERLKLVWTQHLPFRACGAPFWTATLDFPHRAPPLLVTENRTVSQEALNSLERGFSPTARRDVKGLAGERLKAPDSRASPLLSLPLGQHVWQGPDSRPEQRVCPAAPRTCYTWTFFGTWIIGSPWSRCGSERFNFHCFHYAKDSASAEKRENQLLSKDIAQDSMYGRARTRGQSRGYVLLPHEPATPGPSLAPGSLAAPGAAAADSMYGRARTRGQSRGYVLLPHEPATPGPSLAPGSLAAPGAAAADSMYGRARTRGQSRGYVLLPHEPATPGPSLAPGSLAAPGAAAATQPPGQVPSLFPPLPVESQVAESEKPRGAAGPSQFLEELELSTGLQRTSLEQRKGCGGVFRDLMVNTRQYLDHVRESTAGSQGQVVKLFANHFRVTSHPQLVTYKYNVDYTPHIESGSVRANLLFQHEPLIGKCHIFDGSSLLLPHMLSEPKMELVSRFKDELVKVTIKFSSRLAPTSPECLHYYNILFGKILKMMNLKRIGRNYYDGTGTETRDILQHKLEIWPGYFTSILQYENSMTLCADVKHKMLRMETAYDLMIHIHDSAKSKNVNVIEQVSKELVGSTVITKFNNRTYRVDAINWKENPKTTFKKSDGTIISLVDYYKQYHVQVTDLTQPLLISMGKWKKSQQDTSREPILLIPELCYLTGLTDKMRKDYRVMRELALHTRLNPEKRQQELQKFMNAVQKNENVQKELQLWDFRFDTKLLSFSGRILKEVRIFQGDRTYDCRPQSAEWARETRSGQLVSVKSLDNWVILYTNRNYRAAFSLMQSLRAVTPAMGIAMRDAEMLEVSNTVQSYVTVLEKLDLSDIQMVVCVLSDDRKDRYDAIKKYLCVNCPIPSQCVLARTLDKPQMLMTIATSIAQQMNCKMGGALWTVQTGLQDAMFIGIDCFHDIVNRQKSVAGFVASINEDLTEWFSRSIFQESGQELVSRLRACLQEALKRWYERNSFLPRSIFVYRDGVGDGQLQTLIDYEIPQIVFSLENIYKSPDFKLTFIVVKKRINTRFFVESQGRLQNPLPGTIVDVELTRREWYDFFIVSQAVKEGTVTPTHYNVIYDTVHLSPDALQRLTYRLCHMYYNLPAVVRVPAPCYYAHKLAYLVGQSIHQEPHHSLSNRLFYL